MNDISKIDPLVENLLEANDFILNALHLADEHKYGSSTWYRLNEIKFNISNLLHSLKHVN